MDPNYFVLTLTKAFGKFGPTLLYCVGGYFLFIKLPFYFMLKVSRDNKTKENPVENKDQKIESGPEKLKIDQGDYQEKLRLAREEKERQQKRREEEKNSEKKDEKKKEPPRARPAAKLTLAEELFELEAGQSLSKAQLKKRYYQLLKENHPDKVASLGNDFKKLAEKKTKEINSAYEELKKKAS